ncbi:MAG: cation:proton antiporter [Saprospiraceae bacterium]|nr:cation:proton antiporter [Saprospiraceae bacterium]
MHLPLLQDLLILIGFSTLIVLLLSKAKLPSILGFLLTGVIIGPFSLSLISDPHEVEIISEIGVILLMFVIGMELSIKQLASIKKTVFIGGLLQVLLTITVTTVVYAFSGATWAEAVFMGFLISLSSTAIVLRMFQDRNEMSTAQGRNALGILIFQDLVVVPMMLIVPIMSGQSESIVNSVLSLLIKSALVIVITIISARYLVPKLLHEVARTRSKELFLLTTFTICFAVAFLTSEAGLSLALGAFLAGLIISESEYSHQVTSFILPFRAMFTSFFFISVGMLLDIQFFFSNILIVLGITIGVFILKGSIVALAVLILKYPARIAILTGLALFQVGEFAFILSKIGIEYGMLTEAMNQYFLAVSITSMLFTPFVFISSEKIASLFLKSKLGNVLNKTASQNIPDNNINLEELKDHLVIIGFGMNGSHLAKAAEANNIRYVIIEVNADIVKNERTKGTPILFGNASDSHILEHVHVRNSRAIVIAISDYEETMNIVRAVRSICHTAYMVVRSKYVHESTELLALGADDVIPEEFETSIEISSRVLHRFLVPTEDIEQFTSMVRADNYHLLETTEKLPKTYKSQSLPDLHITTLKVGRDSGSVVGKSIGESNIRKRFGVNIVGICRDDQLHFHFDASEKIIQNDLLFVYGEPGRVNKFHELIS